LPYYYTILVFLILATLISYLIQGAKIGNYLNAIRENEDAAEAVGVDTARYKLYATLISAGLTALGGTFYAQYIFFIEPEICFGVTQSINIVLLAIVGGAGNIFGPILGSFILTPLSEFTRAYLEKGDITDCTWPSTEPFWWSLSCLCPMGLLNGWRPCTVGYFG